MLSRGLRWLYPPAAVLIFWHFILIGSSIDWKWDISWRHTFSGQVGYVSYERVKCVVLNQKPPLLLLKHIDELKLYNIHSYTQFTLDDYMKEVWEKTLPSQHERIGTFRRAVDKLGYGRVVWRFDPLLLSDTVDVDILLERIADIGEINWKATLSSLCSVLQILRNMQKSGAIWTFLRLSAENLKKMTLNSLLPDWHCWTNHGAINCLHAVRLLIWNVTE